MNNSASDSARGHVRRVDDDDGGGVAQDDSHTPAIRLTETCSLGIWRLLWYWNPAMANLQLSKQGIP